MPQDLEQRIKLPAQSVLQNWEWNYHRDAFNEKLAIELNKDVFVPKVTIYTDGETNFQGCTWSDGIPVYLPKHIDKVIIYRDKLLPDDLKEKGQSSDLVIMDLQELEPLLKRYDCVEFEDAYCLDYSYENEECPEEIAAAIKAMPSEPINLKLVPWDRILEIRDSVSDQ
ncbi:MAG: hypothetical protein Q4D78_09635 [Neisseria zoodegmatis]|uniref:hypothetical protein n=1 Tax=Neisseria zoodegmatis TaxID=326523 RepID=UPI0026F2EB9B|nr:hypothetical protein [Neisseria zoodegmatis]MDO5070429.1 hypothetical protein [Neisseria zoodegmatis]